MATKGKTRGRGNSPRAMVRRGAGRVRRRLKVHSRKHGVFASLWAILTATLTIAWTTTGLILWGAAALLGGLATVITVFATFDPETVAPGPTPPKVRKAVPRQGSSSRRRVRAAGTAPVKPRKKVCSARCRNSTESVATCRCVCGGKSHGKGQAVA